MNNFSVDQALRKAKLHLKRNQILDAENIYNLILKKFPQNIRAHEGIKLINQIKKDKKGCSGSYKVMLSNLEKVNWTPERYANHKFFMW